MNNIVQVENNELVVTLNDVAEFSGVQYESIRRLLSNKRKDFAELGLVLETESKINVDFKSIVLNEPQSTLLMISLKSNEKVDRFRLELVKQFYKMKEQACEINRQQMELLTTENKMLKDGKIYKDGTMALRTFLKANNHFLKEDEAWDYLTVNGYIRNVFPVTRKRVLVNESIGKQKRGKAPTFNPSDLETIFRDMI